MKTALTILCLFFMGASPVFASQPEATPFSDISFEGWPSVKVQVEGEDFYLLDINGTPRAKLMEMCEVVYAANCQCMFAERFTEMMEKVGAPVGDVVNLRLYRLLTHEVLAKTDQRVSSEKLDELKTNRELRNELCFP